MYFLGFGRRILSIIWSHVLSVCLIAHTSLSIALNSTTWHPRCHYTHTHTHTHTHIRTAIWTHIDRSMAAKPSRC